MAAIIIDDMGSDSIALKEIIGIGAPMDIAVLPMLRHSKDTALAAEGAGVEVMVHQPMEPRGSLKGLGPGALLCGMDDRELRETLGRCIDTVPGAVGLNNHMGSALTEDKAAMRPVMETLKRRGMFFVDSMTTDRSVAAEAAREAGVRSASRRVFLDDSSDPAYIKAQVGLLVRLARRDGSAVAIGHPRPNTLAVLRREIPALRQNGVELVPVSRLVK